MMPSPEAAQTGLPAVQNYLTDVVTGKIAERGLENLTPLDVAMGFSGGGSVIAGEKGALAMEMAGGPNKLKTLGDALRLSGTGATRDEIFNQTGWYKGPDDQWKNIIPDEGASLNANALDQRGSPDDPTHAVPPTHSVLDKPLKLGDVLSHDDLYQAYPWAKDVNVKPLPRDIASMGVRGSYDLNSNTISMAPAQEDQFTSTLLHETQHAIQYREGFATGGNVAEFLPPNFHEDFMANQNERNMLEKEISARGYEPEHVGLTYGLYPWNHQVPQYADMIKGIPDDLVTRYSEASQQFKNLTDQQIQAHKDYMRLGGEVESRNVQAMHLAQQWNQPPWQVGEYKPGWYSSGPQNVPYTPFERQIIRTYQPGSGGYESGLPSGFSYTPVDHDPFAQQAPTSSQE
jgi:hypothetical protein